MSDLDARTADARMSAFLDTPRGRAWQDAEDARAEQDAQEELAWLEGEAHRAIDVLLVAHDQSVPAAYAALAGDAGDALYAQSSALLDTVERLLRSRMTDAQRAIFPIDTPVEVPTLSLEVRGILDSVAGRRRAWRVA